MRLPVKRTILVSLIVLVIPVIVGCANIGRSTYESGLPTHATRSPVTALPPSATSSPHPTRSPVEDFSGERALQDVVTQVGFGPRIPGSEAHAQTVDWIKTTLEAEGWQVEIQESVYMGQTVRNILARTGSGEPVLLLGAHYDTRIYADHDPDPANHTQPVPGANDGASGVAVLLELGRVLPERLAQLEDYQGQIWLAFFDAEDNGRIAGWDWIMGSRRFVEQMTEKPEAVVIVDMIGDADLNAYIERNSDIKLRDQIWRVAYGLGYGEQLIYEIKYSMTDDHTPFLEAGIPAVDIIDFDYPYYHTIADTPDKVSAASLQAVGHTLVTWIELRPKLNLTPTPASTP